MKGMIMLFFAVTMFAGPRSRCSCQVGCLSEIIVYAPRYEHEDIAWSGLMDTVVVHSLEFWKYTNFPSATAKIMVEIQTSDAK